MSVALEDYEEMRDALRDACLKLETENTRLCGLLKEARPYVIDAGSHARRMEVYAKIDAILAE
jgi:hypothetical protein